MGAGVWPSSCTKNRPTSGSMPRREKRSQETTSPQMGSVVVSVSSREKKAS